MRDFFSNIKPKLLQICFCCIFSTPRCKHQSVHRHTSAHPSLWEHTTRRTTPLSAQSSWNVRLTAPDRQLWLQPPWTLAANRRRLRGLTALRTLPRLWRHGRRSEWQRLQAASDQLRPSLPRLINEAVETPLDFESQKQDFRNYGAEYCRVQEVKHTSQELKLLHCPEVLIVLVCFPQCFRLENGPKIQFGLLLMKNLENKSVERCKTLQRMSPYYGFSQENGARTNLIFTFKATLPTVLHRTDTLWPRHDLRHSIWVKLNLLQNKFFALLRSF